MTTRPSAAAPLLAMLAIVAAVLGGYAAGYFWLGQRKDYIGLSAPSRVEVIERHYPQPWLATLYQPAGASSKRSSAASMSKSCTAPTNGGASIFDDRLVILAKQRRWIVTESQWLSAPATRYDGVVCGRIHTKRRQRLTSRSDISIWANGQASSFSS